METKEFYQSLMAVIEYIAAGHSEVTCEKGEELSGEYWPRIYRLFSMSMAGSESAVAISILLSPNTSVLFTPIAAMPSKKSERGKRTGNLIIG